MKQRNKENAITRTKVTANTKMNVNIFTPPWTVLINAKKGHADIDTRNLANMEIIVTIIKEIFVNTYIQIQIYLK